MVRGKTKGFRGNQNLKRPGDTFEWTPFMIEELEKCRNDIVYFAENYFKIVVEDGFELIKLRDYQKEMLYSLVNNRYTISCQSRQSGKSESFRVFIAWYILFHEYKTVAILANKGETAREILSKFQLSYQALPLWMQLAVTDFNKGSIWLENHSRVIATATSKTAARGFTAHVIILDEMAFIENFNEFYSSVYPTISAGKETKLIITSTCNGLNHFYEFWEAANTKDPDKSNGFYPIFVPWTRVPGRDEVWKEKTLKGMNYNHAQFDAEYACMFMGSSGTLIAGWKLQQMIDNKKRPLSIDSMAKDFKMYEHPVKGKIGRIEDQWSKKVEEFWEEQPHKYILLADVSRGKGLDYHAFSVIDVTTLPYKQVATFRSNQIPVSDFADVIHRIARLYNNAKVLTEINDIGEQVGYILETQHEYEHVLHTTNNGKLGKKVTHMRGGKIDKGLRTTVRSKSLGCGLIKLMIEQNKLEIIDEDTVREFTTFSMTPTGLYAAEEGKHDDTVMPIVMFGWLTDQAWFKEYTDIDTILKLREKTPEQVEEEYLPYGVIINSTIQTKPFPGWFMVDQGYILQGYDTPDPPLVFNF